MFHGTPAKQEALIIKERLNAPQDTERRAGWGEQAGPVQLTDSHAGRLPRGGAPARQSRQPADQAGLPTPRPPHQEQLELMDGNTWRETRLLQQSKQLPVARGGVCQLGQHTLALGTLVPVVRYHAPS